jgi:hypothetical protein
MSGLVKVIGVAGVAVAAWIAASPTLLATQTDQSLGKAVSENQGVVTPLGADTTAVSYWTSAPDGWYVVTTVDTVIGRDSNHEQHAIVRFSATLEPGQSQQISVPMAVGEQEQVLRIRRVNDRIEMERIADPSI